MAIGPRLDLRQSQQLVMTPQLQQAIKLLTLTNLELEGFIATEIEKNPLLEIESSDGDTSSSAEATQDAPETVAERPDASADEGLASDNLASALGEESALDINYDEAVYQNDAASDRPEPEPTYADSMLSLNGSGTPGGGGGGEDSFGFESMLASEASLHDHLLAQAGQAFSSPMQHMIAAHLIDMIDEAGYVRGALCDVAMRLSVPEVIVEDVLETIQTFEPTGVGARTLAECLAIQAKDVDRLDPCMQALLDNLELVGRNEIAPLKRLCKVDEEDLMDMIRELRTYNPKPGLAIGGERVQSVVPDVFVNRTQAGGWKVELNTSTLPKVLVNRTYYSELTGRAGSRDDKLFLSECLQSANWLVKALDQRARTVLKVATEILRQQEGFFENGVQHLKPLNLRLIAEAIDMHESTVSRVTNGKYLFCSRGLFELKYFFTSAIHSSDGGDSFSAESVKQRIREMVDAEPANKILSDDKLVELLRCEKFDIARRTVAKYREALRIPSSVQRRRLKALESSGVSH